MRVEILGQERRRRWRDERKLAIVLSVGIDGATVTEVAQRRDVTRQQIYTWRSELKKQGLLPSPASKRNLRGNNRSVTMSSPQDWLWTHNNERQIWASAASHPHSN